MKSKNLILKAVYLMMAVLSLGSGGIAFGAAWVDGGASITTTANAGIGTTAPGAKLHVSGGGILLDNSGTGVVKSMVLSH